MGGVFGGLLGLINAVGGAVLYVLLGSKAWRESEQGRKERRNMGSLVFGLALGSGFYFFKKTELLDKPENYGMKPLIGFVVIPFLIMVLVVAIEAVGESLDK
jgi:hypothetical protein